jgi:predicted metal-binding protein
MAGKAKKGSKGVGVFARLALEMGAGKAKVIRASTIRCEPWVRLKCKFGCPGYNKRLMCPPYTPTPEEMASAIACYKRAVLLHADDNDIINEIVPRLERKIFLAGYYKALGLGSGPCYLCGKCDTSKRCKHPYLARPSMESCGIDVFHTARTNGFNIEVVRTKRQKGDYFGVVLID